LLGGTESLARRQFAALDRGADELFKLQRRAAAGSRFSKYR
jgi:hypothetical protein